MGRIPIDMSGEQPHKKRVVGIDFGTTNSLVAVVDEGKKAPHVLKLDGVSGLVPSALHLSESGEITVGATALEKLLADPAHTITSVKRLIGKAYKDIENHLDNYAYQIIDDQSDSLVKIKINGQFYTPTELSAIILAEIKKKGETALNEPIQKAVITVPAYFNDAQRQAVKDAGKIAGMEVLRIINEPTAAGLAYGIGLKDKTNKIIAVYDVGGGTFDVSILRVTEGIFEVLATKGNTYLGGDDVDHLIVQEWLSKNKEIPKKILAHQLKPLAEKAKKTLSSQESFQSYWQGISLNIDRATLEKLIEPFTKKTIQICVEAVKDAKIHLQDIEDVILVGGLTRIPYIRNAVSSFFQKEAKTQIDPDQVVALGAAIQADVLAGKRHDVLLLDVSPLSLGIETMGGLMDVLIPRNTTIPSSAKRTYTTQKNGQINMRISVYQGERDLTKDNRKLAELVLKGIPSMPAGIANIDITFLIDADGILTVQAKEKTSGTQQQVEVKPKYGLSEKEVEHLLQESINNAKDDMGRRKTIEAKVEAEQLIQITNTFLEKNQPALSDQEIYQTKEVILAMQQSLQHNDSDNILSHIDKLNHITTPFAERIMSQSLKESLKEKPID